ncbi:hypothetical protein NDU88_008218 [Pleurodeles waltl]|uniref:Uncharacterized protein n=1 Tax=Pleurodeles waltl TaxID=8319 RepID=A0AAV7P4C2_PLEWA|nr:hypothetical protein NDU88_008218 [Pleurodeles waltl]
MQCLPDEKRLVDVCVILQASLGMSSMPFDWRLPVYRIPARTPGLNGQHLKPPNRWRLHSLREARRCNRRHVAEGTLHNGGAPVSFLKAATKDNAYFVSTQAASIQAHLSGEHSSGRPLSSLTLVYRLCTGREQTGTAELAL